MDACKGISGDQRGIQVKNILEKLEVLAILVVIVCVVVLLTGCTVASITTPAGLTVRYIDLHPTGNAVETDVTWQGIGTLSTRRASDGVEKVIDSVVPVL